MITVAVINQSTAMSDAQVAPIVAALQVQVTRDFAPVWGIDASLVFVAAGQKTPLGAWQLVVLDDSDQAGALGYHEVRSNVPYGLVFARTDIQNNLQPSVTLSHELLEMLLDPFVFSVVMIDQGGRGLFAQGTALAQEVADACESDEFGYSINNVLVSDFVLPPWFGAPGNRYDFMAHCTSAFQILAGGYIGTRQYRAGQWGQATGQLAPELGWQVTRDDGTPMPAEEIPKGSRRWRRLQENRA